MNHTNSMDFSLIEYVFFSSQSHVWKCIRKMEETQHTTTTEPINCAKRKIFITETK